MTLATSCGTVTFLIVDLHAGFTHLGAVGKLKARRPISFEEVLWQISQTFQARFRLSLLENPQFYGHDFERGFSHLPPATYPDTGPRKKLMFYLVCDKPEAMRVGQDAPYLFGNVWNRNGRTVFKGECILS